MSNEYPGVIIGHDIREIIPRMVDYATQRGCRTWAKLNGVRVEVGPDTDPDKAYDAWGTEMRRRSDEYKASPEGLARQAARDAQLKAYHNLENALLPRCAGLSALSIAEVLDLIQEANEPLGDIGAGDILRPVLLPALRAAGYEENANTGDAFDEKDPENYARWIIGQFMQMPGHGLTDHFIGKWKVKFGGD